MKRLAIILTLLTAPLFGKSIEGQWISTDQKSMIIFEKEGACVGVINGQSFTREHSHYRVLKDETGLILQHKFESLMMDIREWSEDEIILSWKGAAIILERATLQNITDYSKAQEKLTQERLAKSRDKAISNNLRIVQTAGQQYILEEGVVKVSYDQLVGEFFEKITPVNGEHYQDLVVLEDGGVLSVVDADGKEHTLRY